MVASPTVAVCAMMVSPDFEPLITKIMNLMAKITLRQAEWESPRTQ